MVHAPARSEDIRAEVAELLAVDVDAVQPGSNLIGQGLDSIRIMTLAGRWRRQGIAVDFATLAETPTVEAWAELVNAGKPSADRPAEPADAPADAGRSGEDEPFPLAPMQHAMWVGRQENQQLGGVAGHLYVEFDGGGIDPERLRAAATALARRHPMLRVRFLPDGTQRIAPADEFGPFPVHVEDLRERSTGEADRRLAAIRAAKSHQQLDGAVFELAVTLLPAERSRLHVDLDMQAADAMSYRTLMADLAALYLGGDLPELGYTYRQYRQAIEAEDARPQPARDADRAWWARRLPGLPDPPALPTTGGRAENQSTRRWHWLDPHTRDALFARAQARGFTPAMALAAGFANTLARWSTTSRFLLNVPLFGRQALHPDVDSLVGDFTSSLLLDVDLTRANTAAARAQVVQDAMRTAAAHSAYPGLSVLRDLSRHRGTQVLAPVVFTSALGLGELFSSDVTGQFGTPGWIISQGPQVLLDAQVTEFDGGVLVNWDVREGVFPAGVIDAMFAHHIDELLRLASADEAWEAPGPPALPEAQRAVREAANGRTAEPSGEALHDGFFRQAEQRPDAPAVFASSGDLSYAQLRDQALAVAAALRAAGVTAGDTVAVMGPKTAEQIPALLGILSVGAVYLPIGVDQPRDRAERILESGGVRLAVVCGGQRLSMPMPEVVLADVLRGAPPSAEIASTRIDPAGLAYVLFTSGSTGEPKGVEVTHDAAMNTVEFIGRHFDIGPADRCLALSTLEGDISVMDVFVTLRTGGSIVVVDEAQRRDPDAWARLIDAHQVTVLHFMPGWLEMLVEVGRGRLSSVRVVPTGGDWVRPEVVRRLRAEAPNLRFAGLGGATETPVHNSIFEVTEPIPDDWTALPFGVPLPNNACRVVDDTGADCPDWVPGEYWVSGRGIARGYRGRPDLTAERFVEHDGRIWYRTGDLVRYWPDGTLEFVGRADHRVKISGYRVELGEIETALRRVPGVRTAVAALIAVSGESDVLAAQVCADDASVTAEGIRQALADLVPAHMIPRHITVVERIGFTDAGKLDRRAVARELESAVSQSQRPGHRAPSTPLQSALAMIVGDLLGRHNIGIDDDFFALGGDSVLATQAVARIRAWLDAPDIMVADIFANRTVSALAAVLGAGERDPGRLDQVAELYLEVIGMDAESVLAASQQPAKS
ncbi:amino acid adenylation domain-containing protein [Mycobacterium intracellulare]|uniref:Phenyloxazoline synthase MbtB n=1 Tax=Mycobacterium intracellulare TaxID=1767 RepID=A0AAE4U257_MYCIT|nr:non-ribosomal peptide synthetase [Mycobacterium intracellulare]MCA2318694.1 amino acid adenylation domain-containing protein [Mycobacterium intracellulare]MCA2339001.1 amino acid adenylation domain-containing protein [Mycobacterium intracellulare]MDV6975457.1 non-ribosomal peptide synthetase [Mycobacterium intracellulare]MDV6980521.1 non-ribosomal peptide synthetase [Mycobacterium intracellulare]MDV7010950.1 non-ribosomal peptide synthetase [Mycobacterium intracellulare]